TGQARSSWPAFLGGSALGTTTALVALGTGTAEVLEFVAAARGAPTQVICRRGGPYVAPVADRLPLDRQEAVALVDGVGIAERACLRPSGPGAGVMALAVGATPHDPA